MNDTITLSLRSLYSGRVAWGGGGEYYTSGSAVDINKNSLGEEILNKLCT